MGPQATRAATSMAAALKDMISRKEITPQRALLAWLQSGHESDWGVGYGTKALDAYNFGSMSGVGPAGFFIHKDSSPGKGLEDRKFMKFPTPDAGLRAFLRISSSKAADRAAQNGSINQFAAALYENGYYEGFTVPRDQNSALKNIKDYASALIKRLKSYETMPFLGPWNALLPDGAGAATIESALQGWRALYGDQPVRRLGKPRAQLIGGEAPSVSAGSPALQTAGSGPGEASPNPAAVNNLVFKLVERPLNEIQEGYPITWRNPEGFVEWRQNGRSQ